MVVTKGDEFDVIGIQEAVSRKVIGQILNVGDKKYWTYNRDLGDTTYGPSRLGKSSIDVRLEGSSAEGRFNPVYYSGSDIISSELS